jgi:hypothetical protein
MWVQTLKSSYSLIARLTFSRYDPLIAFCLDELQALFILIDEAQPKLSNLNRLLLCNCIDDQLHSGSLIDVIDTSGAYALVHRPT